ncbi:hypothetical protein Glove_91g111 [Diversispora epigaea]|uniref:Uncharacterized protein n=1 Tax=Diversispora epigaea TaxID=1348612 RepID=A0A397J9V0_9GLOM|nr:hypothetical protein Glove_91g111 [Diversispora epigaea]
MSNQTTIKPKYQTCGHITASNSALRLSSIVIKEYANTFLKELEKIIEKHNRISDILYIKIWIFNYIFTSEEKDKASLHSNCDLNEEKHLYKYLQSNYSDINETFTTFYENYTQNIAQTPFSKNKVSRALSALGLKTIMKKVVIDNKPKCVIMISATHNNIRKFFMSEVIVIISFSKVIEGYWTNNFHKYYVYYDKVKVIEGY